MALVLAEEIQNLARDFGLERLGFLTLTFADPVKNIREAQRRFNSLNTHVLKARYSRAVAVVERQKSGRLHYHLVVVASADIKTSCDFEAIERGDYRSANKNLRAEWSFWRHTAPKYRFGRTELLPVRSSAEGIARYVGKYVSKHVDQREVCDKGARIVRFIGFKPGERRASARFSWGTKGGREWRQKLAIFAGKVGIANYEQLAGLFGPRWAYYLCNAICETRVPSEPESYEAAVARAAEIEAYEAGVGEGSGEGCDAPKPVWVTKDGLQGANGPCGPIAQCWVAEGLGGEIVIFHPRFHRVCVVNNRHSNYGL
jgi:hypothetical protein